MENKKIEIKQELIAYEKHEVNFGGVFEQKKIIEIDPANRNLVPYMHNNQVLIHVFNKSEKKIYELLKEVGIKNIIVKIIGIIEKRKKMARFNLDEEATFQLAEWICDDFYYLSLQEIDLALTESCKKLFKKRKDENIVIHAANIYAWVEDYVAIRTQTIEEARANENQAFRKDVKNDENEGNIASDNTWEHFKKMLEERRKRNKEIEENKEREPRETIKKMQKEYKEAAEKIKEQ